MKKFIFSFILTFIVSSAHAIEPSPKNENKILGGGILIAASPYTDDDNTIIPVPIISWRHEAFFIEGIRGGVILAEKDACRLDTYIAPRFMGYDDDDTNILNGMEDRDYSLDGGLQFEWFFSKEKKLSLITSFASDLLNEHSGHESKLMFKKMIEGRIFQLIPGAGIKWQSENLINHYYGVRLLEATSARSTYEPESALNYFIDINFNLGLAQKWFLITTFNAEFLDNEIKNSPIVNEDVLFSGVIGIARKF